jgi:hypothetical protein
MSNKLSRWVPWIDEVEPLTADFSLLLTERDKKLLSEELSTTRHIGGIQPERLINCSATAE